MQNQQVANITTEKQDLSVADLIISEADFQRYSFEWVNAVNQQSENSEDSRPLSFYFQNSKSQQWIKLINFSSETIHFLLSSTGVNTIKAQFAIVDGFEPFDKIPGIEQPTFTIILYGIDNRGARSSAYYVGVPEYHDIDYDPANPGGKGNIISGELARSWIKNWTNIINGKENSLPGSPINDGITNKLFSTKYGYLEGYVYQMMDFMNALYPLNKQTENYQLDIILAAHDHYSNGLSKKVEIEYTFGLVLAGVNPILTMVQKSNKGDIKTDDSDEGVYSFYDLSLPSPPNY